MATTTMLAFAMIVSPLATEAMWPDAYAKADKAGNSFTIGTSLIELQLEYANNGLVLKSLQNKTNKNAIEYVSGDEPPLFDFGPASPCTSKYNIETLWNTRMLGDQTAVLDPATLQLEVRKGDLIGFAVGPAGGYSFDETEWATTVQYADGEQYVSADDKALEQGPVWKYGVYSPEQSCIEEMDSSESFEPVGVVRIPSNTSAFRVPGNCPHVNGTYLHPSDNHHALRLWIAPKDGVVTLSGSAKNANHMAASAVDLSVIRATPKPAEESQIPFKNEWTLRDSSTALVRVGGRPAAALIFDLSNGACDMQVHLTAFPGTPIIRLDNYLVNTTDSVALLPEYKPFQLRLDLANSPGNLYWMTYEGSIGLSTEKITTGTEKILNGTATSPFLPWLGLTTGERGGLFTSLEYIGKWTLKTASPDGSTVEMSANVAELADYRLAPSEKISLPSLVLGVFENTLDDMSRHVYDWQYAYMWDMTNYDHYARARWATEWFVSGLNLQDQFTGRVSASGMESIENARDMGYDMIWDDAGWTVTEPTPGTPKPDFWKPKDGPDFAPMLRTIEKQQMDWNLWIAGNPDLGQLTNYVGSWGNFEWRTDSVTFPSFQVEREWKQMVEQLLSNFPRCAYHTCAFGGTYSHNFDIQRLTSINYLADYGRNDETNYYASLLDTPDKWLDIVTMWGGLGVFNPDADRNQLTSAVSWAYMTHRFDEARKRHNDLFKALVPPSAKASDRYDSLQPWPDARHPYDREAVRRNAEIYHYLVGQGVAGRWSYVERPKVDGDNPIYYFQRLSHDRERACIILKHRTDHAVTIYPKGLIAGHEYTVGFENATSLVKRSGKDLMANGIGIKRQKPAEVIYLGLPDIPGNERDSQPPSEPGRAFKRYETNLGFSGIGVYWSPGVDNNWISYYEIARDGKVLGRAGTGTFYFDRSIGYGIDAAYAVRTIDGDGNASGWLDASSMEGKPFTYAVLGGQFDEPGAGRLAGGENR